METLLAFQTYRATGERLPVLTFLSVAALLTSFSTLGQCFPMSWSCLQTVLGMEKGRLSKPRKAVTSWAQRRCSQKPQRPVLAAPQPPQGSDGTSTWAGRPVSAPCQKELLGLAPTLKAPGWGWGGEEDLLPPYTQPQACDQDQRSHRAAKKGLSCPLSTTPATYSWALWPQLTLGTKPQ